MGTRGRKSRADLAVVPADGIEVTDRPGAPAEFSVEQKQEWAILVNANPAERFSEDLLPLLDAYCRHRVTLRHVGELIGDIESGDVLDIKDYDRLLKMQERESRALASHALRLGLAYSSKRRRETAPFPV